MGFFKLSKLVFINVEIDDKAISANLRHLVKHVDVGVDVTYYEVKNAKSALMSHRRMFCFHRDSLFLD